MKAKNIPGSFSVRMLFGTPVFVFLTALFTCGAIAGSFTGLLSVRQGTALFHNLAAELTASVAGRNELIRGALYAAAGALIWQFCALTAALLRPASLFIAAVVAARGFTLAFSASALLTALGEQGAWLSFGVSGASAIFTVPCLLLTAAAAFQAAQDAPPGGYFYSLGRYRGSILFCMLCSCAACTLRVPAVWIIYQWFI